MNIVEMARLLRTRWSRSLRLSRLIPLVLLAGSALAASCGDGCRCGTEGEEPRSSLLSRVPGDALGILLVPRADRLSAQLKGLYDRLLPQFPDLAKMAGDLRNSVGFDWLAPPTMSAIGLDPAGELLVAAYPDWVLLGIGASDPDAFVKHLRDRFERDMPGTLEVRPARAGAQDALLVVPREPAGASPVLGLVATGKQVLVVPGRGPQGQVVDPLDRLTAVLALPAAQAFPAAVPAWPELQAAAGQEPGILLWLNTPPLARQLSEAYRRQGKQDEVRLAEGVGQALTGLVVGLTLSGERLLLAGKGLVESRQYKLMKTHLTASKPAPGFGSLVGNDAVLLLRGTFDPTKTFGLVRSYLPKKLNDELELALAGLRSSGTDPEAELLASLAGNLAFAFYNIDLSAGLGQLLARPDKVSPAIVETATYVQLTDPARARPLLEKAGAALESTGLSVQTEGQGELARGTVRQGEQVLGGWLREGDLLVVVTGAQRLQRVAETLKSQTGGLLQAVQDAEAKKAVSGSGELGAYLSVQNLMRSFPLIALAVPQAAATLNTLGELALDVAADADGVRGALTLTFKPAATSAR